MPGTLGIWWLLHMIFLRWKQGERSQSFWGKSTYLQLDGFFSVLVKTILMVSDRSTTQSQICRTVSVPMVPVVQRYEVLDSPSVPCAFLWRPLASPVWSHTPWLFWLRIKSLNSDTGGYMWLLSLYTPLVASQLGPPTVVLARIIVSKFVRCSGPGISAGSGNMASWTDLVGNFHVICWEWWLIIHGHKSRVWRNQCCIFFSVQTLKKQAIVRRRCPWFWLVGICFCHNSLPCSSDRHLKVPPIPVNLHWSQHYHQLLVLECPWSKIAWIYFMDLYGFLYLLVTS